MGNDAFADTARAASVLVGPQRMSALPIDTVVMPLQQAIDSSNPAILISADGWSDQRITLPVGAESGELAVEGIDGSTGQTTLTLDPGQRFRSLQTVLDGQRTLLIATSNGAPEQLDSLLAWLDAVPARWSKLSGNAVISPPGRDPVTITAEDSQQPMTPAEDGDGVPYWWIGAGLVAMVVAGTGLVLWRSRRKGAGRLR